MTSTEWLKMLDDDAPDVREPFQRLLDAGFTFGSDLDIQRHADLSFNAPSGGKGYPMRDIRYVDSSYPTLCGLLSAQA